MRITCELLTKEINLACNVNSLESWFRLMILAKCCLSNRMSRGGQKYHKNAATVISEKIRIWKDGNINNLTSIIFKIKNSCRKTRITKSTEY